MNSSIPNLHRHLQGHYCTFNSKGSTRAGGVDEWTDGEIPQRRCSSSQQEQHLPPAHQQRPPPVFGSVDTRGSCAPSSCISERATLVFRGSRVELLREPQPVCKQTHIPLLCMEALARGIEPSFLHNCWVFDRFVPEPLKPSKRAWP